MKKKLTIAAIALIAVLCSFKYSNKEGDSRTTMKFATEQMQTIYYKGHSYICYRTRDSVRGGCGLGASIIHDPDCKCGKGNK